MNKEKVITENGEEEQVEIDLEIELCPNSFELQTPIPFKTAQVSYNTDVESFSKTKSALESVQQPGSFCRIDTAETSPIEYCLCRLFRVCSKYPETQGKEYQHRHDRNKKKLNQLMRKRCQTYYCP